MKPTESKSSGKTSRAALLWCRKNPLEVAVLTFLVTLLALSFGSSVFTALFPAPMENAESLAAALFSALLCSAVVSVPLISTRKKRVAELRPSAALIAVLCLVLSAVGYLVVLYLMYNEQGNPLLVLMGNNSAEIAEEAIGQFTPLTGVSRILAFLIVCLATAYYEEALFRVLLHRGVEEVICQRSSTCTRPTFYAALAVSALFGLLHVTGMSYSLSNEQVIIQTVLKFLQGMLFGLIMTGLLKRSGSFVFIAGLHACYDLLLFFPYALSFGVFPLSYCTDSVSATAALVVSVALLVPAAVGAIRSLHRG